jgi:hypothetical protein
MAARWPFGKDFGIYARDGVGSCSLLCRHQGCELEMRLYHPYPFFNCDYRVSDCGSMAFSEANLKPFVRVCSSLRVNRTRTQLFAVPVLLPADGRQPSFIRLWKSCPLSGSGCAAIYSHKPNCITDPAARHRA